MVERGEESENGRCVWKGGQKGAGWVPAEIIKRKPHTNRGMSMTGEWNVRKPRGMIMVDIFMALSAF